MFAHVCSPIFLVQLTCLAKFYFKAPFSVESEKEGKDQELIQSSTTPDQGYRWESDNVTIRHLIRLKNIKRHATELKWIKFLQSPFPLGFNDNIYHEGNISKMPDFDVFFLFRKKRKSRSHGKRKNGNIKRKNCTEKRLNTSLTDLSLALTNHGRHGLF